MSLILRELVRGDSPAVAAFEQEVFTAEAWSESAVAEELLREDTLYLGWWDEDALIAYGGIKGVSDADIMTLGVSSDHRRQGLAGCLLAELLKWARQRGIGRVFLEVRSTNRSAIELYRCAGFAETGRIRDYYAKPREDAVTMRLFFCDPGFSER